MVASAGIESTIDRSKNMPERRTCQVHRPSHVLRWMMRKGDTISYRDLFHFFFNDPATPELYTLSLHDALPIFGPPARGESANVHRLRDRPTWWTIPALSRSEEHTSELQSRFDLVCRLLLE